PWLCPSAELIGKASKSVPNIIAQKKLSSIMCVVDSFNALFFIYLIRPFYISNFIKKRSQAPTAFLTY
ncbi:MAG: hypothetical protein IKB94_01550, partial [Clostridia bacterium]|nr:hypothetical protein [Clostridia bacterium]